MRIASFKGGKDWGYRAVRKIFNYIPASFITKKKSWQWLRFYPAIIPAQYCFNEWNKAIKDKDYHNYQIWIDQNSLATLEAWRLLQQKSYYWQSPPKISIVTPVHNTQVDVLYECIVSVRAQAYPYWQLILVDDGSSNIETHKLLKSGVCKDPRIQVHFTHQSQGISGATNIAIQKSQGDYIVFLDHDDRLALDALYLVADEIRKYPKVDIVYSDRDMISPKGKRYMYLFKPGWSPETLLAGNYIFHLMCYRRSLVDQLGGLRTEFDGSQDYDLILRAAETAPQVRHIQKVLYHWRQYQGSVSLDSGAKDYAFEAGVKALNEAMQRRGIAGKALEITALWRGNYQLDLVCPEIAEIEVIRISTTQPIEEYTQFVNHSIQEGDKPYIAIISQSLTAVNDNALCHLAAWLKIDGVGLATGGIITEEKLIDYVGATYQIEGELMIPYQGLPISEPGYMAVTQLTRNISAPHPYCIVVRRELWQQLNGLNTDYQGFYSLLDFSLRALAFDWRCVSVPQAQFMTTQTGLSEHYTEQDKQLFYRTWQDWLDKGDPYYNLNLARDCQERLYHLPG
ncbi:MAG: glycosyltransferase [Methyloprofundus sp.]|nr:glycosyltransferase [Methyloprofundus sp.]